MTSRKKNFETTKESFSVIKIQSALNSTNENLNELHRISNERQRMSPDFCLSGNFSPDLVNKHQEKNTTRFEKFFKKEIRTHEKNIKKNPRINLIENTQRLISSRQAKLEKYVLHSTKKLQILSENYQQQKRESQSENPKDKSYFVSLISEQDEENNSFRVNEEKRKKSHEGKRIWKGSTMRKKYISINGRFSAELERYNNPSDNENEEELAQSNKLSLYQSLIYTRKLKAQNLGMPYVESSMGDYSKIDRSKFIDEYYQKRGKSRESYIDREKEQNQFPKKRVDSSSPEVLTIHIKRPNSKFRGNVTQKIDKREYYQPRSMQLSNIFKRPNTTVNTRNRKNSEIEPW